MRTFLIPALAAVTALYSCGSDSNIASETGLSGTPVPASSIVPASSAPATAAAPSNIPLNLNGLRSIGQGPLNPEHGKPGHRCDIAVGAPLNTPAASPASTGGTALPSASLPVTTAAEAPANGLNPEHGRPGHRCDIAVGAPLNSKPNTTLSKPITPVTAPVVAVKPGMNPQHGQPGHRCDIAVGAPLNSKPQQPAAPVAPADPAKVDTSGI